MDLDVEILPTCIVVPAGYRVALTVRGKDYEWQKSTGAKLSNFKNELLGCGPFLHNEPQGQTCFGFFRENHPPLGREFLRSPTGDPSQMKLYGFWRSLATYRVKVALALKGIKVDEVSIDLLKGMQHQADYKAVNPQAVVPALILDDGGAPLFQSMAIMEYLEETKPQPPLLPKDPRGRARVRGLALIAAADGHPLVVPRIRVYLEKDAAPGRSNAKSVARALDARGAEGHRRPSEDGKGNRPLLPRRLADASPTSASPGR